MCITEDKLVDCYEIGLFNRILFDVEYNRRKKNDDDLGVRIQTRVRAQRKMPQTTQHRLHRQRLLQPIWRRRLISPT